MACDSESHPNPELARLIKDRRASVRSTTVQLLGEFEDEWAVDLLIAALRDRSDEVRRQAAIQLKRLKNPKAIFPLYKLWADPGRRHKVLKEALDAVEEVGRNSLDYLEEAIRGDDLDRVHSAVKVLSVVWGRRAIQLLLDAVHHTDPWVAINVAYSLNRHDDAYALESLLTKLDSSELHVRTNAALVLSFVGEGRAFPTLVAALGSEDWSLRMRGAMGLGKLRDPRGVAHLLGALSDEHGQVKRTAVWSLCSMIDEVDLDDVVPPLVNACLYDPDPEFSLYARAIVGLFPREELMSRLIGALQSDEKLDARVNAAETLGYLRDPGAVEPLIRVLQHDPLPRLRKATAEALEWIRDRRAAEPLKAAARDEDPGVRTAARRAWVACTAKQPRRGRPRVGRTAGPCGVAEQTTLGLQ